MLAALPPHSVPTTRRLLEPDAGGRLRADAWFETGALAGLRDRLAELAAVRLASMGSSRAARDAWWDALARHLVERRLDYLLAVVPVALDREGRVAAALWGALEGLVRSPDDVRVVPREALPFGHRSARPPPLPPEIEELARRGAWLCGEAAWDAGSSTAYAPFLLPLVRLRSPRLRSFLSRAA